MPDIATILNQIDSGQMALPEFQRGYVWKREQVRHLFESLYHRHPVGGLLVWETQAESADHRGGQQLPSGVVHLLLDGQQRMTTLYGVARGRPPTFFDGDPQAFTGLMFHLDDEIFEFYQHMRMKDDPLWIDVSALMQKGVDGLDDVLATLQSHPNSLQYVSPLTKIIGITNVNLHIESVTGTDKSLDVVVDIFNRVNSGGTKLSKGDLALAKICAEWPDARTEMKRALGEWVDNEYYFTMDWLLRSMNTILTGEARFSFLHEKNAAEVQDALRKAIKAINTCLNMIGGRLGIDHDQALFGRFAIPVMVRYIDQHDGPLSAEEADKLLFWFVQAGMWGRFSGSTEATIDQDLALLENSTTPIDSLLAQLRLWHGGLRVEPGHFTGWGLGARFYPILYMLTRMGQARDLAAGAQLLKKGLLGKMSGLEVHHIFPKAQLYKHGYVRSEVNALANLCFLTKEANLEISDRLPEDYFAVAVDSYPGALESQWIPTDRNLWKIENYYQFLEARRLKLAKEANYRLEDLLHGDTSWLDTSTAPVQESGTTPVHGGITSPDEEAALEDLNNWVEQQRLSRGLISFDYADPDTGEQRAIFDLVWPNGLQEGLSQPVAVLLDETHETLAVAASAGYRCFERIEDFKRYVTTEIAPAD